METILAASEVLFGISLIATICFGTLYCIRHAIEEHWRSEQNVIALLLHLALIGIGASFGIPVTAFLFYVVYDVIAVFFVRGVA